MKNYLNEKVEYRAGTKRQLASTNRDGCRDQNLIVTWFSTVMAQAHSVLHISIRACFQCFFLQSL